MLQQIIVKDIMPSEISHKAQMLHHNMRFFGVAIFQRVEIATIRGIEDGLVVIRSWRERKRRSVV